MADNNFEFVSRKELMEAHKELFMAKKEEDDILRQRELEHLADLIRECLQERLDDVAIWGNVPCSKDPVWVKVRLNDVSRCVKVNYEEIILPYEITKSLEDQGYTHFEVSYDFTDKRDLAIRIW